MNKFAEGVYRICEDLQPVALAILVLVLVVGGISMMITGADGHGRVKESIKYVLMGAAFAFGGTSMGRIIASWFM